MEFKNLNKSIQEIFQSNYVVPLYQRNYAWTDEEIHQLIKDIYDNFIKNPKGFYFIGTLVVLKRKNGDYEVIDGQQRLTTLSLIAKKLDTSLQRSKLQYDSRPEVESFLNTYYQRGEVATTTTHHLVSHFYEALEHIKTVNLNVITETSKPLYFADFIKTESIAAFKDYFFNQVQLVKVEIPQDIDVAHYFEVMNNRGEQLEAHEIVKARLLDKIQNYKNGSLQFSKIWDACSQMNKPIQRLFNKEDKKKYFGNDYNSFTYNEYEEQDELENKDSSSFSISDILSGKSNFQEDENYEGDKNEEFQSIIDFPNFLMHILKLYFSQDLEIEIPLNGDELLKWFEDLEDKIDPFEFIEKLFYYRVVFDRFIVTVIEDDNSEDNTKWALHKPERYYYEKKNSNSLIFKNSFEEFQEPIIKCLSMLQVTFRTKKYKNYLQEILSWFTSSEDLMINGETYLKKLNNLVLATFNENKSFNELVEDPPYCKGTKTPHFLFNFIDYLYWTENQKEFNFEFKYRNSVEHHLPQSFIKPENEAVIDCLGNLCLVSKSGNSKMNNEAPVGKATENGKFHNKELPPKQLKMYNMTNEEGKWTEVEIVAHYHAILELLNRKNKILLIAHD